jgi:hypothetical protein
MSHPKTRQCWKVDPTVVLTVDPTVDPTVVLTVDPTVDRTVDPTLDPTVDRNGSKVGLNLDSVSRGT